MDSIGLDHCGLVALGTPNRDNIDALRPLYTVALLPSSRLRSAYWAEKLPLEFDACFCCGNVASISLLELV